MEGRYAQEIESGFVYNYGYQCVLSEDSVWYLQNLMPGDKSGIPSILKQKIEGKKLKGMYICCLFAHKSPVK